MAINTRSRRASILGLAQALALTLPLRDGTVGQEDRQHVAYSYAGIAAASPTFAGIIQAIDAVATGATSLSAVATSRVDAVVAVSTGATAVDAVAIRTS